MPRTPKARALTRAQLTRYAEDHDLILLFLDPAATFDRAIVGLVHGYGQELAVLYDQQLVLDALVASGMSEDDAEEWFGYNTIGAYLGEATPRFLLREELLGA